MPTPRDELDPAPLPGRDTPPGPLTIALVVAGGFLIGGPFGLVIAALAVLVWRRHPDWLGALAVGLLATAAVGSVLGAWPGPDSLRQSFAADRPWGAAAGLAAGVSLLVAVARAARSDRALSPAAPRRADHAALRVRIGPWLPCAAVTALAGAVSLAWAPDALPDGARAAAEALRAGLGLVHSPGGTRYPPAALVVAAVFPSALGAALAATTAATAAATLVLGTRLGGRRTGILSGVVAAALPLVWAQQLPGALAGLAVVSALLLTWPDRLTVARAVTAGALLAVGALARPEALIVLPVAVVWIIVWPAPVSSGATLTRAGTLLGAAVVGLVLWASGVDDAVDAWWSAAATWPASVGTGPGMVVRLALDGAAVALAVDELWARRSTLGESWRRHLPWLALPVLAVGLAVVTVGDRNLWFVLGPLVGVGAAAAVTRRAAPGLDRSTAGAGAALGGDHR